MEANWDLLLPIVIIQIVLQIIALVNLARRDRKEVVFENKLPWVLIIIFLNILGPIIYFIAGRKH